MAKPQSNRQMKAACSCGYIVRASRRWLELGAPICPLCRVPMVCEDKTLKPFV